MNLAVDAVLQVNKAANSALDKVNDLGNYTDNENVTHIHVFYVPSEYVLKDSVWVEVAPF